MFPQEVETLLNAMVERGASDLYLTVDAPASLRINGNITAFSDSPLTAGDINRILTAIVSQEGLNEFASTLEYNTAFYWDDRARFRVNLYKQRLHNSAVIRRIQTKIPSFEDLQLPKIYGDLVMEKRGLVLIVGPTGSGKSSSLASMLEHRNVHSSGHIITIEDPVEFVMQHKGCIISQRDIGIDTYSFSMALKNALRQQADILVIGEIRDRETMEHALVFAETGHLCIATLHANNTNQAVERILNLFPQEKHSQILLTLSLNLRAILSQRLIPNKKGGRSIALEIMLNEGSVRALIQEGKILEIRDVIDNNHDVGMQSFDHHLLRLLAGDQISEEVAIAESDNPANLRLKITQKTLGKRVSTLSPTANTSINLPKSDF